MSSKKQSEAGLLKAAIEEFSSQSASSWPECDCSELESRVHTAFTMAEIGVLARRFVHPVILAVEYHERGSRLFTLTSHRHVGHWFFRIKSCRNNEVISPMETWNEIIMPDQLTAVRFYMDLEFYKEVQPPDGGGRIDGDQLCDALWTDLQAFVLETEGVRMENRMILTATTEAKFSQHWIVSDFVLESCPMVGEIVRKFLRKSGSKYNVTDKNGKSITTFVDADVYSGQSGQNFRMIGCPKFGRTNTLLPISTVGGEKFQFDVNNNERSTQQFYDSLIQQPISQLTTSLNRFRDAALKKFDCVQGPSLNEESDFQNYYQTMQSFLDMSEGFQKEIPTLRLIARSACSSKLYFQPADSCPILHRSLLDLMVILRKTPSDPAEIQLQLALILEAMNEKIEKGDALLKTNITSHSEPLKAAENNDKNNQQKLSGNHRKTLASIERVLISTKTAETAEKEYANLINRLPEAIKQKFPSQLLLGSAETRAAEITATFRQNGWDAEEKRKKRLAKELGGIQHQIHLYLDVMLRHLHQVGSKDGMHHRIAHDADRASAALIGCDDNGREIACIQALKLSENVKVIECLELMIDLTDDKDFEWSFLRSVKNCCRD